MARILINSWGSHGDVDPYLALAHALRARGHEPVLAMPAFFAPVVAREGFAFHAVGPDVRPDDTEFVRRVMDAKRGSEWLLREAIVPHVERSYEELDAVADGADLVVGHPVTWGAAMVAERRGLPFVSTVLAPLSFWSVHDLPVFPPAPWIKPMVERWPGLAPVLMRAVRRVSRGWATPTVNALRARRGLAPVADPLFEGQHSPTKVLALFPRVLARPQRDWPAHVTITGALVHDAAHGTALSPELDAFLAAGAPPIVFTLGTSAVLVGERFYVESAAAARRLGHRAVLLVGRDLAGPLARLAGTGARVPDVHVTAAAPHSRLLPRAAAVVHQCGIGTLSQALRAGRPQLLVPWAHDQPDNAWRAMRLGVGRILYPNRYTASRAAAALRALLDDPAHVASAERVAADARAERGAALAVEEIERVLG